MAGTGINVQDVLLLGWQKSGATVKMTMLSGDVVVGVISRFDRFAVLLKADNREILIYKHAIACLETAAER